MADFFSKWLKGLDKTRKVTFSRLASIFGTNEITNELQIKIAFVTHFFALFKRKRTDLQHALIRPVPSKNRAFSFQNYPKTSKNHEKLYF